MARQHGNMGSQRSGPRTRRLAVVAVAAAGSLGLSGTVAADPIPATYIAQGPRPILDGQVENMPPNEDVAGAVHTVVAHPADPDTLWIGTVNGGVWRTNNATSATPTWTPQTDQMPSLSIGALELDPTVATNTVLVAGTGRYSSFRGIGGPRVGIYRTTDAGTSWTTLGAADLTGENISGVAPRGNVIVVAANGNTNFSGAGQGGIFRSDDTGVDFDRISGTNGLSNFGVFDLVGDPSDPTTLYAAAQDGIYRSDDTGLNWTNVTDLQVASTINTAAGGTNNIEMAVQQVGGTNVVYAAVVNAGQLAGLFRSTNQGGAWTAMDIPQTNEGGAIVGLQPRSKPGAQGGTHFSILADPTDATLVYLGGDRQPLDSGANAGNWPNSIGAGDFTGRLFRCDSALPTGSQCTPLTHVGTASNSAPHADSREMVFDANGDIVETNDGGIVRRTSPQDATGDWFSLNGNLQIAEHLSCAYDSIGDIILCGNQDTGAPEQTSSGSTTWNTLSAGDGGYIAVDDSIDPSIRYSSSNNLGANGFRRRACSAANVCASFPPGFIVTGTGGQTLQAVDATLPLYTPLFQNDVQAGRMVVGSSNVYESTDGLNNLTNIFTIPGLTANGNPAVMDRAVAFGGRAGGADNPGVLWFSSNIGGLFLRSAAAGAPVQLGAWTMGTPTDLVLDPENWARAFVSQGANVWLTDDAGASFTDITGNLGTIAPASTVRSLEVVPVPGTDELALLAGTDTGVFLTNTQSLGNWAELGNDLPNTLAFFMEHDVADDVLLVATMGRGAWLVNDISDVIPIADLRVEKTADPDPDVLAGNELFYTVTVTNDGPDTAFGTVLVDQLPDEVTYLENDEGCEYDATEHELTCEIGDLATGEAFDVVVKTLVHSDTVIDEDDGALAIVNTASVSSVSVDPDLGDNTVSKTTIVQDEADLSVTKVCKPDDELPAGEIGFCEIFVDNNGPSAARDIVLTDENLSDGDFTFGSVTPSQGSCLPPAAGIVECELGDLDVASTTSTGRASVRVEVSATEDVDINDVATVTTPSGDPDPSNDLAEGSISVMAVTDLSLTKVGPVAATAGTDISYTIDIVNNGPSTATGVTITDDLGLGVQVLSVSGTGGAGCNAGTAGNPLLPTVCSFGTLTPGAARTMTIDVHVLADTRGPLHNDARVSSETFDDDMENNLDTVVTDVVGSADLSITKTDSPEPVIAGANLTYTLEVTNAGPSTADDVVVTDTLPAGTGFVDGVDLNGIEICAFVEPNQAVCDLGTLQPGESVSIVITVLVDPAVPDGSVLTNTATVTSTTPDPDLADNTVAENTDVITSAELWIDKTGERVSGNPAPVVVYTLVVHNDSGCETDSQSEPTPTCGAGGLSDAQGIVVVDTLPLTPKKAVVQFVSPQCTYDEATHSVTCTSSTIPAGATASFVIEVQYNGSVRTVTNTASVSAITTDPVLTNNTDSVDIVVKGGTGKGKNGG